MRRGQDEARRKKKFAMFVRTPMIYSPPSFYLILYTFCLYIFFFFFYYLHNILSIFNMSTKFSYFPGNELR